MKRGIKAEECPAVLVHRHGPFTWGKDPFKAVENALILEEVPKMASRTERIAAMSENSNIGIEQYLLDKHYQRKHGKMLIMVGINERERRRAVSHKET